MAYKIQIECTHFDDLNFDSRPIDRHNYHTMVYELAPEEDDRIEYIHILISRCYDRYGRLVFRRKRLEIFFNTLLTEDQFKDYINKMINLSFYSNRNKCIDFFDINERSIVYSYDFMTIEPLDIPEMIPKSYKYSYSTDKVYHK